MKEVGLYGTRTREYLNDLSEELQRMYSKEQVEEIPRFLDREYAAASRLERRLLEICEVSGSGVVAGAEVYRQILDVLARDGDEADLVVVPAKKALLLALTCVRQASGDAKDDVLRYEHFTEGHDVSEQEWRFLEVSLEELFDLVADGVRRREASLLKTVRSVVAGRGYLSAMSEVGTHLSDNLAALCLEPSQKEALSVAKGLLDTAQENFLGDDLKDCVDSLRQAGELDLSQELVDMLLGVVTDLCQSSEPSTACSDPEEGDASVPRVLSCRWHWDEEEGTAALVLRNVSGADQVVQQVSVQDCSDHDSEPVMVEQVPLRAGTTFSVPVTSQYSVLRRWVHGVEFKEKGELTATIVAGPSESWLIQLSWPRSLDAPRNIAKVTLVRDHAE